MSGAAPLAIVSPGPLQRTGDALRDRLRLVFPETRFQFDVMPSRANKEDWKRLLRRTPFVGLGWAEIEPMRNGPRLFTGASRWSVFLVTKNVAGARQLYWGDSQGPGLFDMVHAAIAILHGWSIPDIGPIAVAKAGNAYAEGWDGDDFGLATIDLDVGLTLALADAVSGVAETVLSTIGIDWAFGPAGQVELSDVIQTGATA